MRNNSLIKKIIILLSFLFLSLTISAQMSVVTLGNRYSSYDGRSFPVKLYKTVFDENWTLQLTVRADKSDTDDGLARISIIELQEFRDFLDTLIVKYDEWSKTATTNNVTNFEKLFDFESPNLCFHWDLGGDSFGGGALFSGMTVLRRYNRQPQFIVSNSGKCYAQLSGIVRNWSNEYIECWYYLTFANISEIQQLKSMISSEKISAVTAKESAKARLFK